MKTYTGECLCGACRYTATGIEQAMFLCHCSRCQKETGTIHGSNIFLNDGELLWEQGEDNISSFKLKGTRKQRAFCKTCGSPLPRTEGDNGVVIPAGSLDVGCKLTPTAHIFYESRASWEDELSALKKFVELPD